MLGPPKVSDFKPLGTTSEKPLLARDAGTVGDSFLVSVSTVGFCALDKFVNRLRRHRRGQCATGPEDESPARREHFNGFTAGCLNICNRTFVKNSAGIDRTKKCGLPRSCALGSSLVARVVELQYLGAGLNHKADDFRGIAARMIGHKKIIALQRGHDLLAIREAILLVHGWRDHIRRAERLAERS